MSRTAVSGFEATLRPCLASVDRMQSSLHEAEVGAGAVELARPPYRGYMFGLQWVWVMCYRGHGPSEVPRGWGALHLRAQDGNHNLM